MNSVKGHQSQGGPGPSNDSVRARRGEPLEDAIRRIVLANYDVLIDALSRIEDVDSNIATARKAMKRIRSLFRLDRDPSTREALGSENAVLRDIARELAPIRDSFVLISTFDDVAGTQPRQPDRAPIREARELIRTNYESKKDIVLEHDQHLAEAIAALSGSRRRIEELPRPGFDSGVAADEFSLISVGLRRTYRTGARAHKLARQEGTVDAYHRWRKPVKYLRHQIELISGPDPASLDRLVGDLTELGEILGLDHDLDVLAVLLNSKLGSGLDNEALYRLLEAIAERNMQYRTHALALGSTVYSDSPDDFVERIRTYWSTGRV